MKTEQPKVNPELAQKLREKRMSLQWSLKHVAKRVGTSAPYISDVELTRRTIAPSRLRQLVDILLFSKDEIRDLFILSNRLPPKVERRMQKYPRVWDLDPQRVVKALERAIEILSLDADEAEIVADLRKALEPVPW